MEFTKDIQFNNQPTANHSVKVTYYGFLSASQELTIVYGFGEAWENTTYTQMTKIEDGFTIEINLIDSDTFNFCFKNDNDEWDNNSNCNYISPILPCLEPNVAPKFDIDALIEEILEPIKIQPIAKAEELTPSEISTKTVDLGVEITNILSKIDNESLPNDLTEYNTLDEILSGMIVEETPIELLENKSLVEEPSAPIIETGLINIDNQFSISPRKLSKFYLFKKRFKLAFYKALVKIPKMIFGTEN